MSQRFRWLVFLCVFSVFMFGHVGISKPTSSEGNVVITNVHSTFEDTQWIECINEPMHIVAQLHEVYRVVTDDKGRTHIGEHFNFHDFEAVGVNSGLKIEGHQEWNYQVNTDQPLPQEFTLICTLGGESQGSGDNVLWKWRIHITVNANGEVTSSFELDRTVCRG